jgi:transcriptional regulator with XRE-family HTH domain
MSLFATKSEVSVNQDERVGLFIAKHRNERGLTQTQVANSVGISRPYLTQIENGKRTPSDEVFTALLVATGASFEDFLREMAEGRLPEDQINSMAPLLRFVDALQKYLTPEQVAEVMAAAPTPAQIDASLANLGGLPLEAAPDGWADLNKEDRRLAQRLINRLLNAPSNQGGEDEQQQA